MIENYVSKRVALRMKGSMFEPEMETLSREIGASGYSSLSGDHYLHACEYFGIWCSRNGIAKDAVTQADMKRFLDNPINIEGVKFVSGAHSLRPGLRALFAILGRDNRPTPMAPLDAHIHDFCAWLRTVRGLSDRTISKHGQGLKRFLTYLGNGNEVTDVPEMSVESLCRYIDEYAKRVSFSAKRDNQITIRHYCRYRKVKGDTQLEPFLDVHLRRPKPKRSLHHKVLSREQEAKLLRVIGRKTAQAKRDYATTLLMIRLGLRVGDVCELLLDDIDWDEGRILVRNTKARRERLLPLPDDVGAAISDYLLNGRPKTDSRHVFVRHCIYRFTLVGSPFTRQGIQHQLVRYFERAGLPLNLSGTHVLRHTAATRMSGGGANIKSIADVLGHKSIKTTGIYIKTSDRMLDAVAMSWPKEGGR